MSELSGEQVDLIAAASMRGRLAMGIWCLERQVARQGPLQPAFETLLDELWSGMVKDELRHWDPTHLETMAGNLPDHAPVHQTVSLLMQLAHLHLNGAIPGIDHDLLRIPARIIGLALQQDLPLPNLPWFANVSPMWDGGDYHHPISRELFSSRHGGFGTPSLSAFQQDLIKVTSIRGRMALALMAVQRIIDGMRLDRPDLRWLVDDLWRFVEESTMGSWDARIPPRPSWPSLEYDAPHLSASGLLELPPQVERLLSLVIELGRRNRAGVVAGYSIESFVPAVLILDLVRSQTGWLPNLGAVAELSPFRSYQWGLELPRSRFEAAGTGEDAIVSPPRPLEAPDWLPAGGLDRLKATSLRGRMALALWCLEAVLDQLEAQGPAVTAMLDALWTYVEVPELNVWNERVLHGTAGSFIAGKALPARSGPAGESAELPSPAARLIEIIVNQVGRRHLTGPVIGFSSDTLQATLHVLNEARQKGIALPSLAWFANTCPALERIPFGAPRRRRLFGIGPESRPIPSLSADEQECIKAMAVRGRMALALISAEHLMARLGVGQDAATLLLEDLWFFVEDEDLMAWEERIDSGPIAEAVDVVSRGADPPRALRGIPELVLRTIRTIAEIGGTHMYAAIVGFGPESFIASARVLQSAQQEGVELPALVRLARTFPFWKQGGWGEPQPRHIAREAARADLRR